MKERIAQLETEAQERRRREEEAAQQQEVLQQQQTGTGVDLSSLPLCERLWYQRNALFHIFGYCFSSGKGMQVFGNENCSRNQDEAWQAMGEDNRPFIRRVREQEPSMRVERIDRWRRQRCASAIGWAAIAVAAASPVFAGKAGVTLDERLAALRSAYPGRIVNVTSTHVVMNNGREIAIDDGKTKSFEQKLEQADIEDMLSQIYPVVGCAGGPSINFDPGRIRSDAFFKALYGDTKQAVEGAIIAADWFGEKIAINGSFGLGDKLAAVVAELKPRFTNLKTYLLPNGGTFVWRTIAGTARLSAHSFGVAIDISTKKTEYWQWAKTKPGERLAARNEVPVEIISAFERQGFIWGGNWYHFDTMHFEYRPELIKIGNLAKERGCLSN